MCDPFWQGKYGASGPRLGPITSGSGPPRRRGGVYIVRHVPTTGLRLPGSSSYSPAAYVLSGGLLAGGLLGATATGEGWRTSCGRERGPSSRRHVTGEGNSCKRGRPMVSWAGHLTRRTSAIWRWRRRYTL